LAPCIGIDLGIEYEYIDIAAGGQGVIYAAVADIICLSITDY